MRNIKSVFLIILLILPLYLLADYWVRMADIPTDVQAGGALCWDGRDIIYALAGGSTNFFYAYSISANRWTKLLPSIPGSPVDSGGALTFYPFGDGVGTGRIIAFKGNRTNEYWWFNRRRGTWYQLQDIPGDNPVDEGGALTSYWYRPDREKPWWNIYRAYGLKGGGTQEFYRWEDTAYLWIYAPPPICVDGLKYPLFPVDQYTTIDNSPTLEWVDLGASNYRIQLDNNEDFSSPEIDTVVQTTVLNINELADGDYYWRLTYKFGDSWADWTENSKFTINTQLPQLPENAFLTTAKPSFKWQAEPSATQYQLQIDDDSTFGSPDADVTTETPNYTLTEDLSDGRWFWRRRWQDNPTGIWSEWTIPLKFTICFNELGYQGARAWWRREANVDFSVSAGGALTYAQDVDGRHFIYALSGGYDSLCSRYRVGYVFPWERRDTIPPDYEYEEGVEWGGSLAWRRGTDYIYALRGNFSFETFKHSISQNRWFYGADIPYGPDEEEVYDGGSLVFVRQGENDFIYALKGNSTQEFYRLTFFPSEDNQQSGGMSNFSSTPLTTVLDVIPNPSFRQAVIQLSLPQNEKVSLKIYNLAGRIVKTLSPSNNRLIWDCRDENGKTVPSGVYFVQLKTETQMITKKITIRR